MSSPIGPQSQQPFETAALAQRARRVLLLSHWMDLAIRSMPWVLGVALLVVIGVRWWMGSDWWGWGWGWGVPVVLMAGAIGWTGVVAWLRRPDQLAAAGWVDESIHSQSRYRSALELASASNTDQAFASIAVARAEQSAKEIKLPNTHPNPWHLRTETSISSVLLVLIVTAGLYTPSRASKPISNQPSPTAIADAREQIDLQKQELEEITGQVQVDDPLIDEALEDLAALEEELTNPEAAPDPESTAARAASRIEQLADQLDQRSQEQRLKDQALRQQLDQLKSESLSKDSNLERFREQLSEGRYEEAIDELDALDEALDSMSPQERQQAAEDLESLANAIKPQDTQEPPQTDSPQNTPVEDQPDTEQLTKDLADALKDKADRITEPTPSPPPPQPESESQQDQQPEPQPKPQPEPQQDPSEPDQQPNQQQPNQQQPDQKQSDQKQSDQKSDDQSQDNQDQSQSDSQTEQKPGQDQPSSDQPTQTPSQQPSNQGDQQKDQQNDQQNDTESNQPQPGSEPNTQQRPQPTNQPSDKESDQPSEKESTQQGDKQGDKQGNEQGNEGQSTLKEILEDAQRQSEGAQRDRTMAERLREQLEPTPQQPEGSEQIPSPSDDQIDQQDNQQPSPHGNDQTLPNQSTETPSDMQEYVPVQAAEENAQPDDSSNPLGKWYNPDQDRPNPTGQSTQSTNTAQRFRQAAKQAREQVDDRRVPRRYRDVISKYFKQLDERASNIAPSTAPSTAPSSDGTDAPNPKPKTDNTTP